MPVTRSDKIVNRSTHAPYPTHLPLSLPPTFDVDELFDWSKTLTSIESTNRRSLPPRYSSVASSSSTSPSEIERFFTPVHKYSSSPVTPGSSAVKLPLPTSSLALSFQPDIEKIQAVDSLGAPRTSPRSDKPVDRHHSPSKPSYRTKGPNPPAKPHQSCNEVYVAESESESEPESEPESESSDCYEDEQLEDENYCGHKDVLGPGSSSESGDEEDRMKGRQTKGGKDNKRRNTSRAKKTEKEMSGRTTKISRQASGNASKSTIPSQQARSTGRTPAKQGSSGSIQTWPESHEGDHESTPGNDDTPEQPWELNKTRGPIRFRKVPEGYKPGTWTFSRDGVGRQSVEDRSEGDIHFSPGFSGSTTYDYWKGRIMLTIQLVALEDGSAPRKLSPPHFLAWILFYYTARTPGPGTRSQNEKRFDTIGQAQLICWRICNTIKPGGVIAIIPGIRY
ncbi:unnamed protein product [Rhizoctonia solani]|uniref:Uncharacterized protein n=1 Tax=Rhizoctonia solani TaxID=456999 RepID=A0A8H3CXM7_9AGAM|nr:unnamed protein product [Rhizoctonia solani]